MKKTWQEATLPHWDQRARRAIDEDLERAVVDVIETMRENLSERLTVDDMARAARFSKFHFTRVFQRVTGVSPGRFLSALRLQEAKRLLLTTSLSVADITFQVGYNSVGTFSTRFKESVGLSPTEYRRFGGHTREIATNNRRHGQPTATLKGDVQPPPDGQVGIVFVGLFPDWIPQGFPIRCTALEAPGPYELTEVPPGTWHLLAHAVAPGQEQAAGFDPDEQPLFVSASGPIVIRSDTGLRRVDLKLRPMRIFDPPILLALLDVRRVALNRRAQLTRNSV
ncbi:helix-turn-helix domain-containing protein [Actinomadura kijaniata]|uniref:helix-turn-helix domain-containing protein n=1 Tax=Actinomadura kijaniata TaxID=46161 RepID=UPI003F19483E